MTTLEMLKNVREFLIWNRNSGTTHVVVRVAQLIKNCHVLITDNVGILDDYPYGAGGVDIESKNICGVEKGPVLIDNMALKEILDRAIAEIEKLKNKEK